MSSNVKNFGTIMKVSVRDYWKNESEDFTPWLASDENIGLLGDALGLELEVENTEVAVGPYWADILARDVGSGEYIVIENQLTKTDHDHLGKLITYGSVLDAKIVVWLATNFTPEHQKALDWLNDNTSDDLSLYGVVAELWQIDDSRPALRFNVVCQPKEIVRQAKTARTSELTDAKKLQLEFWKEFKEKLLATKEVTSTRTPKPRYWFDIGLGRSGIHLSCTANTFDNKIGVRVYMRRNVADAALDQLLEEKEEIENEIGEALTWNPYPEKQDKIIVISKDADLWKKERWEEYLDWIVNMVIKLRRAFMPRVKKLDLNNASAEEVEFEEQES